MHRFRLAVSLFTFISAGFTATAATVNFYSTHTIGKTGTEVIVDVGIIGFKDIIAMQASFSWDPGLMEYSSVSDFGLPYFNLTDFGTSKANNGHVRFIWEPDDALPVSMPDSTILFRVHFLLLDAAGKTASISFIDKQFGFPIEIVNSSFQLLPYSTTPGGVAIYDQPGDVVKITSKPNTTCDAKKPNGSLAASVNGDTTNYRFHWFFDSNSGSIPDFIGPRIPDLSEGIYKLDVSSLSSEVLINAMNTEVMYSPTIKADTIDVIQNLPQTSCLAANGKIEITVNDRQPADTYTISWWQGTREDNREITTFRNKYLADPLDAGSYEIIVENPASGCTGYRLSTIANNIPALDLSLSSTPNQFCKDSLNGTVSTTLANAASYDPLYFWFNENDPLDTAKAKYRGSIITNLGAGKYKALVIDRLTECRETGLTEVLNSPVYSPATITQSGDTLYASYPKSNWLYNGAFTNSIGPYYVPGKNGNYTITFYNAYNCFCTSEDFAFRITGLDEMKDGFKVYPNPFSSVIYIEHPAGNISSIQVFDSYGRLHFEALNIKKSFTEIDLSTSDVGVYFVKILKDNSIETKKMIRLVGE